jgi:hypothetical protein
MTQHPAPAPEPGAPPAYDPVRDLAALIDGTGGLARQATSASRQMLLGELLIGPYTRLRGYLLLDEPGREHVTTEQALREVLTGGRA